MTRGWRSDYQYQFTPPTVSSTCYMAPLSDDYIVLGNQHFITENAFEPTMKWRLSIGIYNSLQTAPLSDRCRNTIYIAIFKT